MPGGPSQTDGLTPFATGTGDNNYSTGLNFHDASSNRNHLQTAIAGVQNFTPIPGTGSESDGPKGMNMTNDQAISEPGVFDKEMPSAIQAYY